VLVPELVSRENARARVAGRRAPARRSALACALWLGALSACQASSVPEALPSDDGATTPEPPAPHTDAGTTPSTDAEATGSVPARPARPALCERQGADAVRDVFCEARARVGSLRELQALLGLSSIPLDLDEASAGALRFDPRAITDALVVLGHSTALSGQLVSPINPRVLLLGRHTFMAFQRGVQQAELASLDRGANRLNFYLVTFRQACNEQPGGCAPADLFTPRVERDWSSVEIRDDEELKNTPSDCRQCHQRGRSRPILLMRELQGPWTHFFAPDLDEVPYTPLASVTGRDLVRDFDSAKDGELYAGIPAAIMGHTVGVILQNQVDPAQPLEFDAPAVETELVAHDPASGTPRRSPTWDQAYQAFKRGEQLALPYFETRATDPAKQAALSEAYRRHRAAEPGAEQLPDLADIFPDDPQVRAEIGLQTEPFARPAEALIQACGQCHNDVLDQSISRARFNIALSRMSREELELAIARIEQPAGSAGVMPPPETRQLDAAGRARLLEYLRQNQRSAEDDALLEQAAQLGMAKDPRAGTRF
jgi:hypothetical protein